MVTVDPAEVSTDPNKAYFDKETLKKLKYGSAEWESRVQQQIADKKKSCTLYVGNLSFQTTEEQIFELFSVSGEVNQVIMGLDKINYTPCGFCFVEFYRREDAESCMRFINGTKLDERVIRTDWDAGFIEGRQFGRGRSGGQVRDEYRSDFDPDRGGFGHNIEPFHMKVFKEMMSAASRVGPNPTLPAPPVTESTEVEIEAETETGTETGTEAGTEIKTETGTGEGEGVKVAETEVPVVEENVVDAKEEKMETD